MVIVPTEKRFDRERSPVVLFTLVILNVLIFFFYQSNDDEKFFQALNGYEQLGYLDHEWPLFEDYLRAQPDGAPEELAELQQRFREGEREGLAFYLLNDSCFFPYLVENRRFLPASEDFGYWENREQIDDLIQSISFRRFGLVPRDHSWLTLLSHQFLHGGLMHLLGNMFFLLMCGFAVEAAIGPLRFLLFYLLSGVAGGVLHMALNGGSAVPLVGASGAISGVMAMYLGVFRLKKIEFFYWFFIFVGFFRAPALVILPFYIGKELYSYWTDVDSNVAFMAHVGGFLAGSAAVGIALLLKLRILDEEYIEEDQQAPPLQKDMAAVYGYLERFNFNGALKALEQVEQTYGKSFELSKLRYNILKLAPEQSLDDCVLELLQQERLRPAQLRQVGELWDQHQDLQHRLADDPLLKLGWRLTGLADIAAAEQIFGLLQGRDSHNRALGNFARKLARAHDERGNRRKRSSYEALAKQLSQA
ncbi:rhomboid family intramembrane serine protease [Motiliproteus sediminis]|uniref:rhomboid family intramembrane serine protease n=1 Tax=Motiliproteus sediminis TaxID=1468178 RepID=UPI001AF0225B|nr:rhomboid family intramembrane serine protease [Motiliproteus sediminis]